MSNYDPNQPGQPYDPNAGSNASNPNPYGQNPYGQEQPPAYGQNPYAQQPQAPGFDQYSQQGGFQPVQPPKERPKTLQWAFLLIMVAGVLNAVATWMSFKSDLMLNFLNTEWSIVQESFKQQLDATGGSAGTPEADAMLQRMMESPEGFVGEFNSVLSGFVVFSLIFGLVLYFLVGFFVGRGVNAMRVIATICAVISVMSIFSWVLTVAAYGGDQAGLLVALWMFTGIAGIAGVVFSWLRPSSEYIIARRMARSAGYR